MTLLVLNKPYKHFLCGGELIALPTEEMTESEFVLDYSNYQTLLGFETACFDALNEYPSKGPAWPSGKPAWPLHVVNTGSIPIGPSHGDVCLLIHPGDVLKSDPKARSILRSGLNLEGMAEQSTDVF